MAAILFSIPPMDPTLTSETILRRIGSWLTRLLQNEGRASPNGVIILRLHPQIETRAIRMEPWTLLQYPVAILLGLTSLENISIMIFCVPTWQYGGIPLHPSSSCRTGRPILYLSNGHFAGVAATAGTYSATPQLTPDNPPWPNWRQISPPGVSA